MKRIASAFGLLLLAAGVGVTTQPALGAPVTLTWFMWSGTDAEAAAWRHVAELVTQKYPDIKVEFQTASWPDYWTKLPALAASGRLPDIVSLQSMRTPGFASLMVPLDDLVKQTGFDIKAFDTSIIEGLSQDGKLYAVPYDFGPLVIFYNRDLFDKYKVAPPKAGWTEDEFLKSAKALTQDGHFGFATSVPDAFLAFARSAGAPYLKNGQLDLTNPQLEKAFQTYADLVAKDKVAPLFPSSGTPSMSLANGRFAAGDVAMYVDGPWDLINLTHSIKFKLGLAPIPAGAAGSITLSAGSGFGIATTSQHQAEAWKAIQILTGPDAEKYLASDGRAFAARIDDQKYWYEAAAQNVESAKDAIDSALKNAEPYKTTATWNTVSNLMEQYAPLVFGGSKTAAQVLETVQQLAAQ